MRVPQSHRVTMGDVADVAGVSRALVSIVMREVPGASDATRLRIKKVAQELGYVPDERARSLRARTENAIGVCFQIAQPFHNDIVDGIYRVAESAGYRIVLSAESPERPETRAIDTLLANRCAAIITMGSQLSPQQLVERTAGLPTVVVTRPVHSPGLDWVCADDEDGMRQAVAHLVSLGHRDIAFLDSPKSGGSAARRKGFVRTMRTNGLQDRARVEESGSTEAGGASTMERILASGDLPTAIIGFNDRCAAGASDILLRHGIRVPEQISVIGFDDSAVASLPYRSMTSVRQDPYELAAVATRRAIDRLEQEDAAPSAKSGNTIPVHLVVRESSGPVPR